MIVSCGLRISAQDKGLRSMTDINMTCECCSGGNSTSAPSTHIPRVWNVLVEAPPQLSSPISLSPNPAPPNTAPPREMLKTTPTGYLNCTSENRHVVFLVSHPHPHSPLWGLENHPGAFYPLNLGFFIIRFDLDCCVGREAYVGAETFQVSGLLWP